MRGFNVFSCIHCNFSICVCQVTDWPVVSIKCVGVVIVHETTCMASPSSFLSDIDVDFLVIGILF